MKNTLIHSSELVAKLCSINGKFQQFNDTALINMITSVTCRILNQYFF